MHDTYSDTRRFCVPALDTRGAPVYDRKKEFMPVKAKKTAFKKGRWIKHSHLFKRTEFECSVCKTRFNAKASRCPACGALIRGEKYEPDWVEEMEFYDVP